MNMPFCYPYDDEDKYLTWFREYFESVFVAFNPFLRLPGGQAVDPANFILEEYEIAVKQCGAACAVSWAEVAELCGFASVRQVNRALRLTGSKRILAEYADSEDTARLLDVCAREGIIVPDEGYFSPILELSMGRYLESLAHQKVFVARNFGLDATLTPTSELIDGAQVLSPAEVCTEDYSLYATIYIDYHYVLICQTGQGRSRSKPEDFFEGFQAERDTNDFWGIGRFDKLRPLDIRRL